MTKAMAKGNKLVSELSAKMDYLDKAIERLEDEKQALQDKLDTGSNQFDMDVVKKNKSIQQEINLTQQTIEDAKAEREKAIEGSAADTFNQAQKIIQEYRNEKKAEHEADKEEIFDLVKAIQDKVEYIEKQDSQYQKELREFVSAIRPFLDEEPTHFGTMHERKYDRLNLSVTGSKVVHLPDLRKAPIANLFRHR